MGFEGVRYEKKRQCVILYMGLSLTCTIGKLMKARILSLICAAASCMLLSATGTLRAQNALIVQELVNFPDLPADTAYEGQSYNFDVVLYNGTNSVVSGNLFLYMDVDSILITLGSPAQPVNIQPQDTMVIPVVGFNFTQPQFKIGNNIVVVWPLVASGIFYPVDSLITDVFFVPLNSTGIPAVQPPGFALYPNPARDQISWKSQQGEVPGRVRIFDTQGKIVADVENPQSVTLSHLPTGLYFIELRFREATVRERFVKW